MDTRWEHCLDDFLRSLEVGSIHTRLTYAGMLRRFLALHEPAQVTRHTVENFAYAHHARGAPSIATINLRLAAIASYYKYASFYVPEGETEPLWKLANPTLGIPRGKPERVYQVLTFEEFARFFDCIPDTPIGIRDRSIFTFFFWSGRRRAEVARLKWKDIQPSASVASGYTYRFRGKGKRHLNDSMELPRPAVDALLSYLAASSRLATIKPDAPLWVVIGHPGSGGNVKAGEVRQLTERGIMNRLKVYAKQAGIKKMSLHSFRHFAARERLLAGMDIVDLHEYLRHASLDQTYAYARGLMGTGDPFAKNLEEKFARFSKL